MATNENGPDRRKDIECKTGLFFIQMTQGCKKPDCTNEYCATGRQKLNQPPFQQNLAAATALQCAMGLNPAQLCINEESKSPNSIAQQSSTHTASSSSVRNHVTPEPMDIVDSNASISDTSDPLSSHTSSGPLTDGSIEQMGIAASSTLVLVNPSEEELQLVPTNNVENVSSGEQVQTSSSEVSSSFGANVEGATSSEYEDVLLNTASTSDSVSVSNSAESFVADPGPPVIKLSASTLFKSIGPNADIPYLSESLIEESLEKADRNEDGNFRDLSTRIWQVFSNSECLCKSFLLPDDQLTDVAKATGIKVDVEAVRRAYHRMFHLALDKVKNTMVNAVDFYGATFNMRSSKKFKSPLSDLVILLENPLLHSPEFLKSFPKVLQCVASLSVPELALLIEWYSHYSTEDLSSFVSNLNQLITIQLLTTEDASHYIPQSDSTVKAAASSLIVFYFANLLKAKREGNMKPLTPTLLSIAAKQKPEVLHEGETPYEQLLAKFQVHPSLLLSAPIELSEFVNEELNSKVNMMLDYHRDSQDSTDSPEFSFIRIPFALSTANKMEKLMRDNLVTMYSERHRAVIHSLLTGVPDIPFLLLRINRDNIVSDALVQLEAISEMNPIDLRKQLRVDFRGEEGVDEGGLQKEFFQLIVEKLFDPMHGMFLFDESTRQHWFNPASFEGEEQYRLIGILLGLAIYNNIILDIRFPMVIYRKLIGSPIMFEDLHSSHPQIASSLKSLLEFEGSATEFADTFMATFQVSYSDLFDTVQTHNLKEDGDQIPVTKDNRQEYVNLYTEWMLNESIATSFDAFKRGFDLVMRHSYLADLFTAEEVEMLICGSQEWDIDALEESTRYDGFTPSHPVIVNFWQIVREYSEEQKKQLLAFITGSDRIPIGGLAKLKLVVVKNGPDSNRLPTAHTCFNALMLCDYSTKEKLKERLTIAISYAKGFGMI